jgi:hypothetical protein
MQQWNEFGINREADEATYSELMKLRAAVHRFEKQFREREQSELLLTLNRIADTLENIEKKMGH